MKYNDVSAQWNSLMKTVETLHENINSVIEENGYSSNEERDNLRFMRRGCKEMQAILLGYFG